MAIPSLPNIPQFDPLNPAPLLQYSHNQGR